ncbi:hypothetical protein UlMin_043120 [Ulmus minor]
MSRYLTLSNSFLLFGKLLIGVIGTVDFILYLIILMHCLTPLFLVYCFYLLLVSTVVGFMSLFYPYKGKSLPHVALFQSTSFDVFFNIAVFMAGLATTLLLWPTITGQLLSGTDNASEDYFEEVEANPKGEYGQVITQRI